MRHELITRREFREFTGCAINDLLNLYFRFV